jgi:two-component system LytT family response regulator
VYGLPLELIARVTKRDLTLVADYLNIIAEHFPDIGAVKEHLRRRRGQNLSLRVIAVIFGHRFSTKENHTGKMVKDGSNYVLVNHNEIILITREGRDTVIYSKSGQVRTDKNLTELEELLGGYPFIRSHKGFIINLEMVRAFVPSGRTCYEVIMANTPKRPLITWEKVKELEEMTLPKK